jgi:hypothetical protein
MTIPGFGAEASLYRTVVSRGVAGASEQPASAVHLAQGQLRYDALLGWRDFARYVRPDCPDGLVARWVQTGGYICRPQEVPVCNPVTLKCVFKTAEVCGFEPFGYEWQCQLPTFTALP